MPEVMGINQRGSILAEAPVHASLVIDTVSIDSRLTGKDL
ncbi:hypothetical protein SynSYN20_01862 [Synechococcus sp. SYN20]|nr:hypothetical protein SynSYN20_01862 [Synechococcus sp. SYN20]